MSRNPNQDIATLRSHRARRAGWLVAALASLAASAAMAQGPLTRIEECLESGTDLVTLPGVAGGTLTASECRGCPSLRLSFGPRTRYFIGDEAVPYARLREAAGKGALRLYVFYRPTDRTLTRLRLVATDNTQ
jgi:hypothetical protein